MRRLVLFSQAVSALVQIVMLAPALADTCSPEQREAQRDKIRSAATANDIYGRVTCDLNLNARDVITRILEFVGDDANGITVDCSGDNFPGENGGAILNGRPNTINAGADMIAMSPRRNNIIRFLQTGRDWARPENIVIKNCTVFGSIRLYSMPSGGPNTAFGQSSRCTGPRYAIDRLKGCVGHTSRAQAAAPRKIEFRKMTIVAQGRTPLYLAGGVNHVWLVDSKISGRASAAAIYLDAETSHNVIQNNVIGVAHVGDSRAREQISIDGSAYNLIIGNRFVAIRNGAIHFYRNCGERGEVRHQAPQYNRIINNEFHHFSGNDFAIWLGSRNQDPPGFCDDDDGIPFGSGASDRDFARHNVIADNRIIKGGVSKMIRADDRPNEYHNITTVESAAKRPSNCYDFNGFPHAYLAHGESTPFMIENGAPVCRGVRSVCNDGIVETGPGLCPIAAARSLESFECSTTVSNAGVACTASCPEGFVIQSAKAACNLETNDISLGEFSRQGWGTIEVQRASDNLEEGLCRLNNHAFNRDVRRIADVRGTRSVSVSCREHDKNGGDCMISGVLACVKPLRINPTLPLTGKPDIKPIDRERPPRVLPPR